MSTLNKQELAIHCGKTTDSFEKLKVICEEHANELKNKIEISTESEISVPFWTKDFQNSFVMEYFERIVLVKLYTN